MATKRNTGSIVGGAVLIIFGLLALFSQLFRGYDFWGNFWPFIIIGFGALFFVGMLVGGKQVAGLAIPGSIIMVIGLMLLLQNLTNYWESWSYGWTVIVFSVGLGIFLMGAFNGEAGTRRAGLRVMEIGFILFIIFGAFFEMIFSAGHPSRLSQWLFPAALVLLGVYLVLVRSGLLRRGDQRPPDQPDKPAQEQ